MAGLAGSSDLGAGIAVGHLAFDIGEYPRLVVIAGQGLVHARSLYISSDYTLVVGID